jgi:hypothetical protein
MTRIVLLVIALFILAPLDIAIGIGASAGGFLSKPSTAALLLLTCCADIPAIAVCYI